jgi:sporulation protein YlmC with PRC-barrel domain
MIRNLLATTAIATLAATAAYAQNAPAPAETQTTQPAEQAAPVVKADGYLASNIMGESVYNGTGDNAENIGDVNDIVLSKDGNSEALIVGVGGFLGIGEHNVAVEWSKLSWAEANGDRWLVYPATKEELEALPAFDRTPYDPAPAPVASNDPNAPAMTDTTAQAPATAPATTDQAAQTEQPAATDTTTTAAIDKSTLTEVPADKLTTEQDLIGTTVYGVNDEQIGEISDVVLTQDGKVDAVIVDVGGFLGMGEKKVAMGFDKLKFMADKDGDKYLYTPFTKDQLNAQTAYDESSYAENRDKQLLIVQ